MILVEVVIGESYCYGIDILVDEEWFWLVVVMFVIVGVEFE